MLQGAAADLLYAVRVWRMMCSRGIGPHFAMPDWNHVWTDWNHVWRVIIWCTCNVQNCMAGTSVVTGSLKERQYNAGRRSC